MSGQALSIRQILVGVTATLTLLIALMASREIYAGWIHLRDIRALSEASRASNNVFDAADKVSVERDVALSMLQAADAETIAGILPRLNENRRDTTEALRTALSRLDDISLAELPALRADMQAGLSKLQMVRSEIDTAIGLPASERDASLPKRWTDTTQALIATTDRLWAGLIRDYSAIDPVVTQQLRFKRFVRIISDYSGRERSLIGQLIAENSSPTPEEIAELQRDRGILAFGWDVSRELATQSGIDSSIGGYYTDANSHYSTMNDMTRGLFDAAAGADTIIYPISLDLWFELSKQASELLVALRNASIQATREYVNRLNQDTSRELLTACVVSLFAFALCAWGLWTVLQRVVGPINRIIEALLRATRGEDSDFVAPAGGQDEIGKLAIVLQAFQRTVEQVKHTALALSQSQSRLASVVDHALDGLITVDAHGTVQSFNPACERIFGRNVCDAIGRPITMLVPGAGCDVLDAFLAADDDATSGHELTAFHGGGTTFPIELLVSTFPLQDGRNYLCIVRDITLRQETERERVSYMQALERSNHELDEFAYIASHDLKEPLRGIHNHSRFLLEDNADKLDTESVGRLTRLTHLSQRMERLVNDLLYFSRLGRQDLAVQATDVNALILDVENTLDLFLKERNARVVIPEALPVITCDLPRVTEVFRNLITNAVKYNDKSEIIVEIGSLRGHLAGKAAATHVFYVKDNGKGINPEFHQDIFRMFKRLQAGKDKEDGSGVGLTFVKKIVERHGGEIWLESELGKGTTFYFTLEDSRDDARNDSKAA